MLMVMKRSHRVALKPTAEQEVLFGQHAGYARFAYNWALGEFRAGLEVGEWLSERTLRPRWNRVKGMMAPWALSFVTERRQVRHHRLRRGRAGASTAAKRSLVNTRVDASVSPGLSAGSTSRVFAPTTGRTR